MAANERERGENNDLRISSEYLRQKDCIYFLASFESLKNFGPLSMAAHYTIECTFKRTLKAVEAPLSHTHPKKIPPGSTIYHRFAKFHCILGECKEIVSKHNYLITTLLFMESNQKLTCPELIRVHHI